MAEIGDVIRADGAHILCWQVRLGQLRRGAGPASGPDLAATWDTVTALIDLHARAEEEICDQAIYGTGRQGRSLAGGPGTPAGTSARSSAKQASKSSARRIGGAWPPPPWPPGRCTPMTRNTACRRSTVTASGGACESN